jgi:hypothetical protein
LIHPGQYVLPVWRHLLRLVAVPIEQLEHLPGLSQGEIDIAA